MKNTQNEVDRPFAVNVEQAFLQALDELKNPPPTVQLSWWPLFNECSGGFRPREFTILCGSTGSGKTEFCASISAQLLESQVKHFVMSVETGHTDFTRRVISALAKKEINTGEQIPVQTIADISLRVASVIVDKTLTLSLYDNRVPSERLCFELTHMAKSGHKVAIIDNLNFFLEVTRAADQIVEMDRVIHDLIILCKRIDMHVIMIMHPRKTESGRVEDMFDIKGSSTAVQEAHNVFLFNRPKAEDIKLNRRMPWQREIKIAKMRRRGKYVGSTIVFEYAHARYGEIELA